VHTGAPGKYLLSSLLRCHECGANYVIASQTHCACASQVNGCKHYCGNTLRVARTLVEDRILDDVERRLLAPAVIAAFCKEVPRRLAELYTAPKPDNGARRAELETEIANLVAALARRGESPAIESQLKLLEGEKARLEAETAIPTAKVLRAIPRRADDYRNMVANLGDAVKRNAGVARADLRALFPGGEIRLRLSADRTCLEPAVPESLGGQLIQLAVSNGLKNNRVAGEGFEPSTFGL
jgi:hypothetical protein